MEVRILNRIFSVALLVSGVSSLAYYTLRKSVPINDDFAKAVLGIMYVTMICSYIALKVISSKRR